ncbi:MAG: bifunctional DNA-formamidopyrimidine glycosylase/DNA-(apurinic or apyrimidinic site) lyase [Phycisphaerales bacterium]
MPELPEVEHVRRSLLPHLLGERIAAVLVRRASVVKGPRTPKALLAGALIARIDRRGKQMALVAADGRVLVIHLGMSGQVLCDDGVATLPPHVHIVWTTQRGTRVLFRDPRRFGGVWPLAGLDALQRRWVALGPDGLDTPASAVATALVEACRGSRRAVKAALLDQHVLAGVGNIYADEACFLAGIRPTRRAQRLKPGEAVGLARALRSVLAAAVAAGGSSLRDYVDADGRAGEFVAQHAVYGRGGLACVRCGGRLRQTVIAQRTTVFCPTCQR